MKISSLKLVYFSPTGTSKKVLDSIAAGMRVKDIEHIDLTLPEGAEQTIPPFSDELVIIGAPVYGGRLPADAVSRFRQMRADNTPAVLIVLYGNRDYEDALLELKRLSIELGFNPVAGGAFIGEHSFATKDIPIANGRPDSQDAKTAMEFGAKIQDKITALTSLAALPELKVSGRSPYLVSGARSMQVAPVTDPDACTACRTCAAVCPTAAIPENEPEVTLVDLCIRCCACIKTCPEEARRIEDKMLKNIATGLSQYFTYPKEPRLFGIEN